MKITKIRKFGEENSAYITSLIGKSSCHIVEKRAALSSFLNSRHSSLKLRKTLLASFLYRRRIQTILRFEGIRINSRKLTHIVKLMSTELRDAINI